MLVYVASDLKFGFLSKKIRIFFKKNIGEGEIIIDNVTLMIIL
jgi:hypothetical protein